MRLWNSSVRLMFAALSLGSLPVCAGEIEASTVANVQIPTASAPSTDFHTDYGVLAVGGSYTRSFRVHNLDNSTTLSISVYLLNSGDWGFGDVDFIIAPNSFGLFNIRFQPGSAGVKNTTLSIFSDDGDESPYTIQFTGEAQINPVATPLPDLTLLTAKPIKTKLNKKTGLIDAKLKLQVSNLGDSVSTSPIVNVFRSETELLSLPSSAIATIPLKSLQSPKNGKFKNKKVNIKLSGLPNSDSFLFCFVETAGSDDKEPRDNAINDSIRGIGP